MSGRGKGRQLRVDAQRNREHIMATVESLLPENGPEVPMEEIARAAGVGVGTLYRRFGSRDELIETIAEASYRRVMVNARQALDSKDGAWDALTRFLTTSAPDLTVVACLSMWYPRAWVKVRSGEAERRRRAAIMDVVQRLFARAQTAGAVRADIDVNDLVMAVALMLRPLPEQADSAAAVQRRLVIALDGFRCAPGDPLPGASPRFDVDTP